jgi:hypothetical protein
MCTVPENFYFPVGTFCRIWVSEGRWAATDEVLENGTGMLVCWDWSAECDVAEILDVIGQELIALVIFKPVFVSQCE